LAVRRVFRRADAIARARWQPGDPALARAAARTPLPRSGTRSPYLADEFGCGVADALSPALAGHRRLLAAGARRPPALTGHRPSAALTGHRTPAAGPRGSDQPMGVKSVLPTNSGRGLVAEYGSTHVFSTEL